MEYVKKAIPTPAEDRRKISEIVSEIILNIEKNGIKAVRKYSEKFD